MKTPLGELVIYVGGNDPAGASEAECGSRIVLHFPCDALYVLYDVAADDDVLRARIAQDVHGGKRVVVLAAAVPALPELPPETKITVIRKSVPHGFFRLDREDFLK